MHTMYGTTPDYLPSYSTHVSREIAYLGFGICKLVSNFSLFALM